SAGSSGKITRCNQSQRHFEVEDLQRSRVGEMELVAGNVKDRNIRSKTQDGGAASVCSSGGQRVGCQMNFGSCVNLECVDIYSLCLGGIQLARECLCVLAETGTLEVTHFILKVSQG